VNEFVADTHAVIWYLSKNKRLSRHARTIFDRAAAGHAQIAIPTIVIVETAFLIQRARLERSVIQNLLNLTEDPTDGIYLYPLNLGVVKALVNIGPAVIPELADRVIAATALHLNLPLLTTDAAIQTSNLIKTVW
jgi:PIN domain nuclease of toxin-antitoxin system